MLDALPVSVKDSPPSPQLPLTPAQNNAVAPEVANRGSAETTVRYVPGTRTRVTGIVGITQGHPVPVACCHG